MKRHLFIGAALLTLAACTKETTPPAAPSDPNLVGATSATQASPSERLDSVLAAQSEGTKSRYAHRHPKETLEFFGIEPGMTVVDTLPGDVWYAGLLLDYLGPDGKVIGADYSPEMWTHFGDYSRDPKESVKWPAQFVEKTQASRGEGDAAVAAFQFGAVPDDMAGTVDVVLMSRALHHLMRLEDQGGYMSKALADLNKVLKPGGIVGVEQHRAPEQSPDDWAKGNAGYVKQSAVIAAFERAGFEFVGSSEVNANPKDQPTPKDVVWRLPPTLATSESNAELKQQMESIGESDRMTLKFRKPA